MELLSDAEVQSFIVNGYVQVQTAGAAGLSDGFHRRLYEKCRALSEGAEAGMTRFVFPEIPELSALCGSAVVQGALTSLLGPDYVQHPHRTQHTRGTAEKGAGDQAWHKDGHHTPIRSHYPRWLIGFYYPTVRALRGG
jgi:hypothetical protein